MFVAMPYFLFMEVMVSGLINGETFFIFGAYLSQFQFCSLVGKGEDGPCVAALMLNPMMCIISLFSVMCHMDLIDAILSRMTSMSFSPMW